MKNEFIKSIFNRVESKLNKGRFIFRKVTPKNNISDLINNLKPYSTEYDLIRFGGNGDGGYLIPDDIEGIKACFSPGVYKISEFEMDCLKVGMNIFMADKSVNKPNLEIADTEYDFIQKFIGCTDNSDFITMGTWVETSKVDPKSDLLLQMDIEGAEYASVINMSDNLIKRFRIIVIEFHSLQDLWEPRFFDIASMAFNKILQTHTCVHIHPNNSDGIDKRLGVEIPRTAEFTFLKSDRIKFKTVCTQFPHALDYDNTERPHIPLPSNWFK